MPNAPFRLSQRFNSAFRESGISSLRRLAKLSGNSPSQMQSIASGAHDFSPKGPGIIATRRTADVLGTSLDYLVPPVTDQRPGLKSFLFRYEGVDTPIHAFADFLPYCDVYAEPSGGLTHLDRLGPHSMLSQHAGITDTVLLQIEFESWPTARKKRIYERQRRAWDIGVLCEPEVFNEKLDRFPDRVWVAFILAACRVRDENGDSRLLVYCEPP